MYGVAMPYFLASSDHLVHQFLLLAVDADLVEQVADLAPRPQVLDELLVVARSSPGRSPRRRTPCVSLPTVPVSLIAAGPLPV